MAQIFRVTCISEMTFGAGRQDRYCWIMTRIKSVDILPQARSGEHKMNIWHRNVVVDKCHCYCCSPFRLSSIVRLLARGSFTK
jgi:hypothetical protein